MKEFETLQSELAILVNEHTERMKREQKALMKSFYKDLGFISILIVVLVAIGRFQGA